MKYGKEFGVDFDIAFSEDHIRKKEKRYHFIMVDKPEKALTDFIGSAFHSLNREQADFNSEKEYLKYRNRIPKEIGLICSDNLYGFGIITQIMRQSGLKNS